MLPLEPYIYNFVKMCSNTQKELFEMCLIHLPLVTHIYMSVNQVIIGLDNGLSPIRRKAII